MENKDKLRVVSRVTALSGEYPLFKASLTEDQKLRFENACNKMTPKEIETALLKALNKDDGWAFMFLIAVIQDRYERGYKERIL